MKKVLLFLLTLLPIVAEAQFTGDGFYRAQNYDTKRFIAIVDNKTQGVVGQAIDIDMLNCLSGFDEQVVSNPATICYITKSGEASTYYTCALSSQELSISSTGGMSLQLGKTALASNVYTLKGAKTGVGAVTIADRTGTGKTVTKLQDGGKKCNWYILPVNESANQYFGIKGEVTTADGKSWSSLKAAFAYEPVSAANTKVYTISKVRGEYAVLHEVTGRVPAKTSALFCCSSAAPADNKLKLYVDGGNSVGANELFGVYFSNDVDDSGTQFKHRNMTAYDASTMRVLGLDNEGKPAFVKGTADNLKVSTVSGFTTGLYLTANKAYLKVPAGSSDVIKIVTEEEYATLGIHDILMDQPGDGRYYDLQGRQVETPTHGLYIVNGRKVVVK